MQHSELLDDHQVIDLRPFRCAESVAYSRRWLSCNTRSNTVAGVSLNVHSNVHAAGLEWPNYSTNGV